MACAFAHVIFFVYLCKQITIRLLMRYLRYMAFVAMLCMCIAVSATEVQTYIPTIRLQFSALSKDTFSAASFIFANNDDTLALPALIRNRGGRSLNYQKKSYAIKLLDENGQKKDTAFFDMRKDNYWILDAMAIDKARMRNRVAMDLWLDFSAKPYYAADEPNMCNGYRGKFVEVYVNDEYQGLYCLTERVDRKQLKLKKAKNDTINGVLYKSAGWQGGFFRNVSPYDNQSATWMRFEYEYPDAEDSLITWTPLYEVMNFVDTASAQVFAEQITSLLDIPVWMDYYIFTNLLSARDNCGNNLYLSYYNINLNSKLLVTPWDVDHSFGRMYNAQVEDVQAKCNWSEPYKRLERDLPDYYTQLLRRYAELRGTFFTPQALTKRFSDYFDLFYSTGVAQRETERWNGVNDIELNFPDEEDHIASWIEQRLIYTDSLFQYSPQDQAIDSPDSSDSRSCCRKILCNGQILILRGDEVYTLTGSPLSPIEWGIFYSLLRPLLRVIARSLSFSLYRYTVIPLFRFLESSTFLFLLL